MDRKNNSRIKSLEFILRTMSSIKLRDAANILSVSEMTLRRDLSTEGCPLILLGGHIVKAPQNHHEANYLIFEQENKNLKEKMAIGKAAAELVDPFYCITNKIRYKIYCTLLFSKYIYNFARKK